MFQYVSRRLCSVIFRKKLCDKSTFIRDCGSWISKSTNRTMEVSLVEMPSSQLGVQIEGLCAAQKRLIILPVLDVHADNHQENLFAILDDSLNESNHLPNFLNHQCNLSNLFTLNTFSSEVSGRATKPFKNTRSSFDLHKWSGEYRDKRNRNNRTERMCNVNG